MIVILTFTGELDNIQKAFNALVIVAVAVRCILILTQSRDDANPLSASLQKCKKVILAGIIAVTLKDTIGILQTNFFVSSTGESVQNATIFSGGKKLLEALISAFMALDIAWTVVDALRDLFCYIKGNSEEKEQQKQKIQKTMIIGILILVSAGFIKTLLSYFGG